MGQRPKCKLKLVEENIGISSYETGLGSGFLDITPKTWTVKEKIDQFDFIKIENFCIAKVTLKKVERQPTKSENICKYLAGGFGSEYMKNF